MVPLLIGGSWLLVVSLVLGLCAAARDGDFQQDPSSSAVRQPARPGCGTVTRVTHLEGVHVMRLGVAVAGRAGVSARRS